MPSGRLLLPAGRGLAAHSARMAHGPNDIARCPCFVAALPLLPTALLLSPPLPLAPLLPPPLPPLLPVPPGIWLSLSYPQSPAAGPGSPLAERVLLGSLPALGPQSQG